MHYKDFYKYIDSNQIELVKYFRCLECAKKIQEEEYFSWGLCKKCLKQFKVKRGYKKFSEGQIERYSVESQEWHYFVLLRDKFICQRCGGNNKLEVHHIKSWAEYPKLRYDLDNGQTLCRKCHIKIDKFRARFKSK